MSALLFCHFGAVYMMTFYPSRIQGNSVEAQCRYHVPNLLTIAGISRASNMLCSLSLLMHAFFHSCSFLEFKYPTITYVLINSRPDNCNMLHAELLLRRKKNGNCSCSKMLCPVGSLELIMGARWLPCFSIIGSWLSFGQKLRDWALPLEP